MKSGPVWFACLLSLGCNMSAHAEAPQSYPALVKAYFDGEWRASPTSATSAGLHDWDSQLDDVSAAAQAREIARLTDTLARLRAVNGATLSPMDRDDRDILAARIDGQLLQEQTVQQWRHNPAVYVDLMTGAVYSLIERDFAPLPDRMRNVVARENRIPVMLADAKRNLENMPSVFVDIALENLDGAASFLGKDVPGAFADVKDEALKAQLTASTKSALAAVADYKAFLVAQKSNAHGDFRLGRNNLQRLLASDMVTVPVERVLAAGQAQLAKDRAAFLATEKVIDPANPSGALAMVEADHPDGAHLISTARDQLEGLQRFIEEHHIVTLPSQMLSTVAETPAFARALVFGELDPPGALETHATKAYYFITPPDPSWSKAEQDKYLGYFNTALLQNLSVHEALPGHFVQYLYARANPGWSMIRKTGQSYTATEGWAHYSEQMMLDEGLGNGDPKLRLTQLQDALLRDCRLVASLQMHTGHMTLPEATTMMEQQCFQPASVGPKEARRGTADPGYFSYTLGKLEILKLRDDVQKKEGASFTIAHFHDRFLSAGLIPIAMIRREMLGTDGPAL
ncbi:MAG TPA: DUF885 domain-containing protein [Rhizomicrobium sp.]|jgi:uncharacterized protein (DUF885 family)